MIACNVDATSPVPEARISALILHVQSLATPVDIVFVQEVPRSTLSALFLLVSEQQMSQLSALVHSRSCPGGLDHVPTVVAPKFHEFTTIARVTGIIAL